MIIIIHFLNFTMNFLLLILLIITHEEIKRIGMVAVSTGILKLYSSHIW